MKVKVKESGDYKFRLYRYGIPCQIYLNEKDILDVRDNGMNYILTNTQNQCYVVSKNKFKTLFKVVG